ncbi:MAG: sensor histidine kinase [Cupriavidus sp.]|jgi:two-component system C4-dicarboxylate transport sensor histidine kinase DctB|uniref:sensor histidine kinase n=1 Tax=Cupriavidus pauculus TaxID=82633 RepID=UPI000782F924|nr:ATP-binding protein [Cupriavidus pauculus]MBU68045.1 sensor histidine kinase [Cupriavidus sp.]KAB0604792.1 sensor histidine kinase [Cupriavidus pauculus]MBY4729999.1 sensor histidine kinase [Cupriavidus pauculus]MCM3604733.1 ATP-binding protein [Cupriavidus pauculus]UAK98773.1 sensor histidine kinase [Cupriavidus pauculus]
MIVSPSDGALSPWRRVAPFVALLALAALVTGAGWLGYRYTFDTALARQAERGQVQMRLYAQALESELARYDYVPSLLSLDARIDALLRDPRSPERVAQANAYLAALNGRAGTRVVYVLDAKGRVLATSNYQRPDSFLGEDLSFRPYFRSAIEGQLGRFYGVGTTRSESGYYLSAPLGDRDRPVGVAVVKIGLEPLENRWQGNDSQMLLADENGVVILASDPSWKLAVLRPLSDEQRARLDRNLQYNRAPLPQLALSLVRPLANGPAQGGDALVRLRQGPPMLAQHLALPGTDWDLTLLTNTSQARVAALNSAALAGVLAAFVLLLAAAWNVRRRIASERQAARAALEAANSELERKVAERTADLSATNQQLQAEVAERIRTEAVLRQAQDGLLQAGKLAAVGQMSAGIAHELNQPLAALRTLSGNAEKFMARGDYQTAQGNLEKIVGLVERMGRITGALRSFARNPAAGQRHAARLGEAVDNALFLLETRVAAIRPRIARDIEPHLAVACDPNRLEQVLVNLIGNALDAIKDRPDPQLSLHAYEAGGMVHLTVRDNGPGLSEAAFARLFEPFFTTKPAGEGLGLGLTLSAGILNENGGSLTAINHPDGGACFTLALPQAREEHRHVG